jgi:magnesium-transporting ATPase (P-type)
MVPEQLTNFMAGAIADFKESPRSVKNGLTVLVLAWLWHFITLYRFFLSGQIPGNQIVIGILICFFVFLMKNWARVLCIVCNILIVFMYLFVGSSFYESGKIYFGVIALMNVALFSLASYFLLLGTSAAYYKSKMPKKEETPVNDSEEKKGQGD